MHIRLPNHFIIAKEKNIRMNITLQGFLSPHDDEDDDDKDSHSIPGILVLT